MIKTDKASKPRYIFLKIWAAVSIILAIFAVFSFPLKTVFYEINTDEISTKLRIVQISDLHSCSYGKDMSTLIDAVDESAPDIVVFTGDIYDDVVNNDNTRVFMKNMAEKYPCYYVAGNHERRSGKWKEFRDEAEKFGVVIPEGKNIKHGEVTICGASEPGDGVGFEATVDKCAQSAGDGYNILLAHYPDRIGFYRSYDKFDLVLSGHAHGGHWRIPYLVNGIFAPDEGFFPEYAGGRYDFDNGVMIVSRGLSRTKNIIPRLFNNPELVVIDLIPS